MNGIVPDNRHSATLGEKCVHCWRGEHRLVGGAAWHPPPRGHLFEPRGRVAGQRVTHVAWATSSTTRRDHTQASATAPSGRPSTRWGAMAGGESAPGALPRPPVLPASAPRSTHRPPTWHRHRALRRDPRSCLGDPRGRQGHGTRPSPGRPPRPRVEESPRPWPPASAPRVHVDGCEPRAAAPEAAVGRPHPRRPPDASACPHPRAAGVEVAPGRPACPEAPVAWPSPEMPAVGQGVKAPMAP